MQLNFKQKQNMKKIILTIAAVFAFGFANAQEVKYGVKAGLGLSSISGLDGGSTGIGFNIGGFAKIGLADKFAFQPELLFSSVGAKQSYSYAEPGYSESSTIKHTFNYINIPLMVNYKVANKFGLEVGPQIGFLMSYKAKMDESVTYLGTTTSTSSTSTDKSGLSSTSFGLNLGAGYDLTENLNLGLRYSLGLSKLQKELATGATAYKNNVIWLNLGYSF